MNKDILKTHAREVILPYWQNALDLEEGGFFACLDQSGEVIRPEQKKGLVQHARMLWSFSYAYEKFGDENYLFYAKKAFDFLTEKFWDHEYGGFFYYVSRRGEVVDDRKHLYPHSFTLYALSQYYLVSKDTLALNWCHKIFDLMIKNARDYKFGGYNESFDRKWNAIDQIEEYGVSKNEKTMNTHIHLLEAVTLYASFSDDINIHQELAHLIDVIIDKVYDPESKTLVLFFDPDWTRKNIKFSFGHDIETSWLLIKALKVCPHRNAAVKTVSDNLCDQVSRFGVDTNKLINNEWNPLSGHVDKTKYWWVQLEAMVGFMHGAMRLDKKEYYQLSEDIWNNCQNTFWDTSTLEWYEKADDKSSSKSSHWKTPYHTLRALMECHSLLD